MYKPYIATGLYIFIYLFLIYLFFYLICLSAAGQLLCIGFSFTYLSVHRILNHRDQSVFSLVDIHFFLDWQIKRNLKILFVSINNYNCCCSFHLTQLFALSHLQIDVRGTSLVKLGKLVFQNND